MTAVRMVAAALAAALAPLAAGQTVQPPFDSVYTVVDLGTPAGVPGSFGGLTLKADDPSVLLIGGSANQVGAMIYAVPLARTCGRVTGFAGGGTAFAEAPNIDGGLAYGPGGVLFFTRYSIHQLGQILPGQSTMHRSDPLGVNGFAGSVGAMQVVPPSYAGTGGALAFASYNSSQWARAVLTPAGDGSYDIGVSAPIVTLQGGPEGIIYVPAGSPHFPAASVLVSEWAAGAVSAYEVDANGDPIPATRRVFISGLSGAEGAYIEPATGDFFFSTFGGGDRVIVVRGFSAACPGDTNGDNIVDFADLNNAISNFNATGEGILGDVNLDCLVSFADLNVIVSFFNNVCN
ncbi:MAG: hypothetical protein IBJ10_08475 [Phycisphaerales bacterium]|nr:hypothetical protein [Phycisphaerales bacterium]